MFQKLRSYIKANLSPSRAEHVFAVEQLMLVWAAGGAVSPSDVKLVALGHDLARELPPEVLLWLAELQGLPIEPWEREVPMLLHGKVGVSLLQWLVGEVNDEVRQAIVHHTLGARDMGPLCRLLYCADYLEPNRRHLDASTRATLSRLPLEEMFVTVARQSLTYHKRRGVLYPPSRELLESLCE